MIIEIIGYILVVLGVAYLVYEYYQVSNELEDALQEKDALEIDNFHLRCNEEFLDTLIDMKDSSLEEATNRLQSVLQAMTNTQRKSIKKKLNKQNLDIKLADEWDGEKFYRVDDLSEGEVDEDYNDCEESFSDLARFRVLSARLK